MSTITDVKGRLVFNSRGNKAIEIDVITDSKFLGRACAPSGASVGKNEVQSFVENSPERTLENFNSNKSKFIGIDSTNPRILHEVLREIDKTETYSIIGGAVAYALSIASIDSASKALQTPFFKIIQPNSLYKFPFPLGNVLGGGAHAGPGTPDIQEFLVCPKGAKNIFQALEMNFIVHKQVMRILENIDNKFTYGRGDEGGWAPNINNEQAFEVVEKAITNSGFTKKDVAMGIDFASSSLWNEKTQLYHYSRQGINRTTEEQIEFVNSLIKDYDLIYAEDPVHEEDFQSMSIVNSKNKKCFVTGDDMLVTNKNRVKIASKIKSCSGAILKVNQAGTIFDALEFANECMNDKIGIITSHRSGESIDSHIAHIAIATNSKMLKTGILGGERIAKLNELLRINEYDLINGLTDLHVS
ncbi:MAG: enolase [Nitrososphaeraceae archaeon]|nr:enolase [Nitrososphaeraceae archaeon]